MRRFSRYAAVLLFLAGALHAQTNPPMVLRGATVQVYFSPDGGAARAVVDMIDGARQRVMLAGYLLTSYPIARALKRAHARGVQVRVVLDSANETDRYSGATYLARAGIDVVIDKKYAIMHHKFIIADRSLGFGSMNFTRAGDEKNAENFNIFRGAPALLDRYRKEFERLYRESEPYRRGG